MAKTKTTPTPTEEVVNEATETVVVETPTEEVKGEVKFEANDKSHHLKKGVVYTIPHSMAIRFEKKGFGKITK